MQFRILLPVHFRSSAKILVSNFNVWDFFPHVNKLNSLPPAGSPIVLFSSGRVYLESVNSQSDALGSRAPILSNLPF